MRLLGSTVLLGLSWFAAINLVLSVVAWAASRTLLAGGGRVPGPMLLALRLLPSFASLLFVGAIFLPAHVRLEPANPDEQFGVIVAALAVAGFVLLAHAAARGWLVWSAARQSRKWSAVPVPSLAGDAYEVHGFPGVSLAGILRTRILVGSGAREALSSEELALAIAHEQAHRHSLDNLKRCAIFCAPDFFGWTAAAAQVEECWRAQAECDADIRAVNGDERRAVHLASALLKVARLGGHTIVASPAWSAFNEPPLLEARIRSLVAAPVLAPSLPRLQRGFGFALGAIVVPVVALVQAPHHIHQLTEVLVSVLP